MKLLSPTKMLALAGLFAILGSSCGSDATAEAAPLIVVESAADGDEAQSSVAEDASASSTEASDEEQALAFAECMRTEGIDFPDPVVAADGSVNFGFGGDRDANDQGGFRQEPGFDAAREECGDLIDGASFLPSDDDQTEREDTFLAAAQCLRDEGIDVSDPDFGNGGPGAGGPFGADFDPDDPATAAAIEACQDVFTALPQRGGN